MRRETPPQRRSGNGDQARLCLRLVPLQLGGYIRDGIPERREAAAPADVVHLGIAYDLARQAALAGLIHAAYRRKRAMEIFGDPAVDLALRAWGVIDHVVDAGLRVPCYQEEERARGV